MRLRAFHEPPVDDEPVWLFDKVRLRILYFEVAARAKKFFAIHDSESSSMMLGGA